MSVTFINPFLGAESGGGGGTFKVGLTIAASTVGSDLTNYPVLVQLSDMPAGFWTHVKTDGGDIRVKTSGGTLVPMDLVWFDHADQDGQLFFLAASLLTASSNVWYVHYGNAADNLLPVTDTNGRNAVWANFEAVFLLGDTLLADRTGGADAVGENMPNLFEATDNSPNVLSHQGVCWDGTYYYTFDTNTIRKWDASWTSVLVNSNPIGDAAIGGTPTISHCGDGDVHGGLLYIPMECYPNSGGLYNGHIGVFNASDLSFVQAFDISAQAHESSGIAYRDDDGLLYITDYDGNNSTLYKYDPSDGSYIGSLACSAALTTRQGLTWWRDAFWVSTASAGVYQVSGTGTVKGRLGFLKYAGSNQEGIGHRSDALLHHMSNATDVTTAWRPLRQATLTPGGGAVIESTGEGTVFAAGRTSYQTYTMACSMAVNEKSGNRCGVSYWKQASGGGDQRQVIAYSNGNDTLAIWDNVNGWLLPSPGLSPTIDQVYRTHAVYQGNTSRKFYVDGALKATQSSPGFVQSGLDTLRMLSEDTDVAEPLRGAAGFFYLYPGVLSADYIAAEYANLNAPASFYSVGSETSA